MKNFRIFKTIVCFSVIFIGTGIIYQIYYELKNQKFITPLRIFEYEPSNVNRSVKCLKSESISNTRIFCMMLTHKKSLKTRAKLMTEAWAKYCDNFKLVLLFNNDTSNLIEIDHVLQPPGLAIDAYNRLTDKVFYALKYIYSTYPDYDWYLKADDDTYVFTDNLRWFLSQKKPSKPITFGYDFKRFVIGGYHSGGGGYVMSREAVSRLVKKLNKNYNFCENTGTEDIDVNRCLRRLGVHIESSTDEFGRERFHPISFRSYLQDKIPEWLFSYAKNTPQQGYDCCSETTITFHYVNETDALKILLAQQNLRKNTLDCITNVHEVLKQLNL